MHENHRKYGRAKNNPRSFSDYCQVFSIKEEYSIFLLNHPLLLDAFYLKHGSSNTGKLIDLCYELGNENLSELEELLYSKADLPSNQVSDAQLSSRARQQINLAPLELLMGLDSLFGEHQF